MALNAKQEQFAREYLVDLNATQAAIRAGYSERTANEQAVRLMKMPEIAEAISAAKGERSELTKVTAGWVLQRLADEANADLADLYDADGNLLPVDRWPLIWRRGLVQGVDVEVIGSDGDGPTVRIKKIRVSDRVRRLELIGKHIDVSAFTENHKVQVQGSLADRLQRAIDQRNDEQERIDRPYLAGRASVAKSATPLASPQTARAGEMLEEPPAPSVETAFPPVTAPDPMPIADAAIIVGASQPAAYQPILAPWPQQQVFADGLDYRPISDD